MSVEFGLNGVTGPAGMFVGWAPVPAQARLVGAVGPGNPTAVTLRAGGAGNGGRVVFYAAVPGAGTRELPLQLPADGSPVDFLVGGEFGRPSRQRGDASIEVVATGTTNVLRRVAVTVRVRKDAALLSSSERDRLVAAFARLNDSGRGIFAEFRNVHTDAGDPEAHGNTGFLPWHRCYLLDLERELQAVDPSVSLPYWRFDRPAPSLFSREFMGVTSASGLVQFSATNPLQFWVSDGVPGIVRRPQFDTRTQAAQFRDQGQLFRVRTEAATMALGGTTSRYSGFRTMEENPHGWAHVSFTGYISDIPTAARDPLFFLLHANVDRLWAKWQWSMRRFDAARLESFAPPNPPRVGHALGDTMWPWNGVTGAPRPPTAPGGPMPASALTAAPGPTPTVRSMLDYQGVHNRAARLGFDYDDVPFEF